MTYYFVEFSGYRYVRELTPNCVAHAAAGVLLGQILPKAHQAEAIAACGAGRS